MKNAPYSRKIKRLVIKNFLNHKHTVIEFADGINLFAGSSSSGKSTIMRAWLGMVCDEYRSEWINNEADHCSVKIEFFNGDVFERVKGPKHNMVSTTVFGEETKVYKKFGAYLPEEVVEFLGSIPRTKDGWLNYIDQHNKLFLLNLSKDQIAMDVSRLLRIDDLEFAASKIKSDMRSADEKIKDLKVTENKIQDKLKPFENLEAQELKNKKLTQTLSKCDELSKVIVNKDFLSTTFLTINKDALSKKKLIESCVKIEEALDNHLEKIDVLNTDILDKTSLLEETESTSKVIRKTETSIKIADNMIDGDLGKSIQKIDEICSTYESKKTTNTNAQDISKNIDATIESIDELDIEINDISVELEELEKIFKDQNMCSSCGRNCDCNV
jgi:predicted ATP-dependent endonuclease of OLD family